MKTLYFFITTLILSALIGCTYYSFTNNFSQTNLGEFPAPTEGISVRVGQVEGGDEGNPREDWEIMMHRTAPEDDWKAIEQQNMMVKYKYHNSLKNQATTRNQIIIANGNLSGSWSEKGSDNQAGSITAVDFDDVNDQIYAVSPSGTLWKGDLSGTNWVALNESLGFRNNIMEVTQTSSGTRILAAIGGQIYYSDDDGGNWLLSSGLGAGASNGAAVKMLEVEDGNNSIYYIGRIGGLAQLYVSTDHGTNFSSIHTFSQSNGNLLDFWTAINTDEAYLLDADSKLYSISPIGLELMESTSLPTNTWRQLRGSKASGVLVLYAFLNKRQVYQSIDNGVTWNFMGSTPINSWGVGMMASPWTAARLFMGEVNTHKSTDGGASWSYVSQWYQYYSNINKIHADVMTFDAFETSTGTPLILVGSHGGIHASYDDLATTINVATQNLNNAEYYDVRTNPIYTDEVYSGAQDQGWQRTGSANTPGPTSFEQAYSGDYGNLALTGNGQHLWTVYPFGNFNFYSDPQNQAGVIAPGINIDGSHPPASNWIWPTSETYDVASDDIYVGGGSLDNGPGSFLITLSVNGGSLSASQFPYDFRANSNSGTATISAISPSYIDPNTIYVVTSDGTFFYTHNGGASWSKSSSNLAGGSFIGATIYASKHNPDVVWMGGSGYSNSPVFKSLDGGATFTAINSGLPNTLMYDLTANPDETLLFAATEAGAYVYVAYEKKWYDLMSYAAPQGRYFSVEYVEALDAVRFGTFGRGIWDFNVTAQPALPVEWLSFEATTIDNKSVKLDWITASEFENDYFEIQRSANGKDFERMDEIPSMGMSNSEKMYEWTDNVPLLGNNYYRIKQVDRDGSFEYSEVRLAKIAGDQPTIAVYPNPVMAGNDIQVKISKEGQFLGNIFNTNGQLIKTEEVSENGTLSTQDLPAGNYFYRINGVDNSTTFSGKIVVSGR